MKSPDSRSYDGVVNGILGMFGPVPPGGDSTFPALLMLVVGIFGCLSLAVQIRKTASIRSHWPAVAFAVAILSFVMSVSVLLLLRGSNHHH